MWTPPLFVQQRDADSEEFPTQPMGTLQACARARLQSLQEVEEFDESHFPDGNLVRRDSSESSSGRLVSFPVSLWWLLHKISHVGLGSAM